MMSRRSAGGHYRQPQHIAQLLEPGWERHSNHAQRTANALGAWEVLRRQKLKVMLFPESSAASSMYSAERFEESSSCRCVWQP